MILGAVVGTDVADSPAFEWVCDQLIDRTSLDRLEARGTVRIALKQSGLEARNVTSEQMTVILGRVLPCELESRGVDEGTQVCRTLASGLSGARLDDGRNDSPEEVFRRLGGS